MLMSHTVAHRELIESHCLYGMHISLCLHFSYFCLFSGSNKMPLASCNFWNSSKALVSPGCLSGWHFRARTRYSVVICSSYLQNKKSKCKVWLWWAPIFPKSCCVYRWSITTAQNFEIVIIISSLGSQNFSNTKVTSTPVCHLSK